MITYDCLTIKNDEILCFSTVDPKSKPCGVKQKAKFNGLKYCGSLKNMRGPFGRCISKKVGHMSCWPTVLKCQAIIKYYSNEIITCVHNFDQSTVVRISIILKGHPIL